MIKNTMCEQLVAIAIHVRRTNPCEDSIPSLSEALDVADCCRQLGRDDLAIELLEMISLFPRATEAPIAVPLALQRHLIKEGNRESLTRFHPNEPLLPPIWIRGWNFAIAMSRWAKSGLAMRNQDEINERLAVCHQCPNLVDNQCRVCGCPCVEENQVMNKLALKSEVCPLGLWK